MPVNPEIAATWPTQFHNPVAGHRVSLDELYLTSVLPIREPQVLFAGIYSASALIFAKGFYNRDIGSMLRIAEQTVKNHLHFIFSKGRRISSLGTHCRSGLSGCPELSTCGREIRT